MHFYTFSCVKNYLGSGPETMLSVHSLRHLVCWNSSGMKDCYYCNFFFILFEFVILVIKRGVDFLEGVFFPLE
jgi:hypothetical protein